MDKESMQAEPTGPEPAHINGAEANELDPIAAAKNFVAARAAMITRLVRHRDKLKSDLAEANEELRHLNYRGGSRPRVSQEPKRGRPQGSKTRKEATIVAT